MRILPILIFDLALVILYWASNALCGWYDRNKGLRMHIGETLETPVDMLLTRLRATMRRRAAHKAMARVNEADCRMALDIYLSRLGAGSELAVVPGPKNIRYRMNTWLMPRQKIEILSLKLRSRG